MTSNMKDGMNGYKKADARETLIEYKAKGDENTLRKVIQGLKDSGIYPGLYELCISLGIEHFYEVDPIGILCSEVIPEPIVWRWKGRLAKGKLTLLDGDPGLGKTTLMLDVAARMTRGRSMPGENQDGEAEGVVLVTLEDGIADTIVPRLSRMGADLSKIISIGFIPPDDPSGYERPFQLPGDLPLLEAAIERVHAGLVLVDPIMAIVGNKDIYRDNEVRMALAPLRAIAEKKGISICMTRHLTKGGGENAIYRGGGSIAFIGLARIGLIVARDQSDETLCVLANSKNNLGAIAPSLSYRICNDEEEGDPRSYIKWLGISNYSSRDLLVPARPMGATRQEIIGILEGGKESMTPQEIWEALIETHPGLSQENIRLTLKRMKEAKEIISPSYGKYTHVTPVTPVTLMPEWAQEASL